MHRFALELHSPFGHPTITKPFPLLTQRKLFGAKALFGATFFSHFDFGKWNAAMGASSSRRDYRGILEAAMWGDIPRSYHAMEYLT